MNNEKWKGDMSERWGWKYYYGARVSDIYKTGNRGELGIWAEP